MESQRHLLTYRVFLRLRSCVSLFAAGLLLLGVVVHSLQQQKHLNVHGLREQIHGHGSHWTEWGSVYSVGWCSAQTKREICNKRFTILYKTYSRTIYFVLCLLVLSSFIKANNRSYKAAKLRDLVTHSMKLFMAAFALHAT